MKLHLILFTTLIFSIYYASAQTIYTHDTAGNRVKRFGAPVLPVTLVRFEALKVQAAEGNFTALLKWETASEVNSDFFDVQRSGDAKVWHSLGKVRARGGESTTTTYEFSNKEPLDAENFYRLKMLDKDGTFAYSQIRSLHFESQILAYPNPVKQFLQIKGWASGAIQIFSNSGKLVYEVSNYSSQINLGSLSTGVYILKLLQANGTPIIRKIVKE